MRFFMNNIRGERMVGIVAIAIAIVTTTSVLVWKFQNSFYFSKTESVKKVEAPKETPKEVVIDTKENISKDEMYRNEKYGFELQYPASWIVSDEGFSESDDSENGKIYSILFSAKTEEEIPTEYPYVGPNTRVGFQIYPSRKSLDDFLCSPQDKGKTCYSSKEIVSGEVVLTTTFEQREGEGMGNKEREIYLVKGGNVFQFYSGFNGISQSESLSILAEKNFVIDQIAASIRFLK